MSIRPLILVVAIFWFSVPHASAETPSISASEHESTVTRATLFEDRVEVTRRAAVSIAAGQGSIRLGRLPATINPASLKVKGSYEGNAKVSIEGVEYRTIAVRQPLSAAARALDEKIRELRRTLQTVTVQRSRVEHEQALLRQVALQPKSEGEGGGKATSPASIKELYALVSQGLAKLGPELISLQEKGEDLAADLQRAEQERAALDPRDRPESFVDIALSASQPTQGTIELTYTLSNMGGWRPVYMVSVNTAKGSSEIELQLFAQAYQRTGEDWRSIPLNFSTSQPGLDLARPEPGPRFIDIRRPQAVVPFLMKSKGIRERSAGFDSLEKTASDGEAVASALAGAPFEMEESPAALVDRGGVQLFAPSQPLSLAGDGSESRIKLSAVRLEGIIRTVAIPERSLRAYREAVVRNTTGAPLLPGEAALSSDGAFVGTISLGFTPVNAEVTVPLGFSDSVSLKRTLVKKYEDDSGIVSSVRRIKYDYLIEVESLAAYPQNLVVLEGIPLSRDEKIKTSTEVLGDIKPLPPKEARLSKVEGVLEWQFELKPSQKLPLRFTNTVEFAAGLDVTGVP